MKGKILLAGVIGSLIGTVVTAIVSKYYYENKVYEVIPFKPETNGAAQEEEALEEPEIEEEDVSALSVKEYAQRLQKRDEYVDYSGAVTPAEKKHVRESVRCVPYQEYLDHQEEHEDESDYTETTLYYYEDGVLADEDDQLIDEDVAEKKLGKNWSDKMTLYDDDTDSAYFINEDYESYYEVLRSAKYYYGDVVPDDDKS